jgi:hypothetical protein
MAISRTAVTASTAESVTRPGVGGVDHPCPRERSVEELRERAPEVLSHPHEREIPDLARLDQRGRLEDLVERTEPTGQRHERVRVLYQHHPPHEEMPERDPVVEV